MNDPFGERRLGASDRPPPAPFEMPVAEQKAQSFELVRRALMAIFAFVIVVGAVVTILYVQGPYARKELPAELPATPSATGPAAPRRGAIARSAMRKKVVVVNDFATDAEAEAAARDTCGVSDCVLVETFAASCVARAVGKGDRQEIAYGHDTREAAEQAALAKCGKGCSIQAASCPHAR